MALICTPDESGRWAFGLLDCFPEEPAGHAVEVLTVASVVMAAAFGLMALFTSYKDKEGRTTRYGRLAAAGVVLTALVSLTINTLKGEVDGAKAAKAAKKQQNEYEKTLAGFEDVLGLQKQSLIAGQTVQAGLRRSLAGQSEQLKAQRNQIALSQGVSRGLARSVRTSQANADALLRSVWDASDAVSLRDLSVRVSLGCGFIGGDPYRVDMTTLQPDQLAPAFSPEVEVRIKVLSPGSLTLAEQPLLLADPYNSCVIPTPNQCDTKQPLALEAVGTEHTIIVPIHKQQVTPRQTTFTWRTQQVSGFSNFAVTKPGLARRSDWNGAIVQVSIRSPNSPFTDLFERDPEEAEGSSSRDPDLDQNGRNNTERTLDFLYPWAFEDANLLNRPSPVTAKVKLDQGEHMIPCMGAVSVLLQNRLIGAQWSQAVLVPSDGVFGRSYGLLLVVPPFTVPDDAFPRFMRAPPATARAPLKHTPLPRSPALLARR